MSGKLLTDQGWPSLLAGLPGEPDVAELARAHGPGRSSAPGNRASRPDHVASLSGACLIDGP